MNLWMKMFFGVAVCVHAISVCGAQVLVVGADESGSSGDAAYTARMAGRLSGWLADAGVSVRSGSESEFRTGTPSERVTLLVSPVTVGKELLRGYSSYLRRGGKLIVFYGSSPELAELMGLRLGKYTLDKSGKRFAAMRFGALRPEPVPLSVEQRSRNIRPAWPLGGSARVMAEWCTEGGVSTGQPAWLECKSGFWMTHVLLPGGNKDAKQLLLLGLVCACDPGVWGGAARSKAKDVRTVLHGNKPFARLNSLLGAMPSGPLQRRAERMIRSAYELSESLDEAMRKNDPKQAWMIASRLEEALVYAFGALQQGGSANERRIVWERTGEGPYPGDWDRSCRILADAGMSEIFVHVLSPGYAHYPGGPWPVSDSVARHGDSLRACIAAARKYGLRVSAWVMCWPTDTAPDSLQERWRRDGRLVVDVRGNVRDWLDPSDKRNRSDLCAAIIDLVERYDVDGVHLDYIRYPDGASGFGSLSRKRYTAVNGTPADWPRSAWIGEDSAKFRQWRAGEVTRAVREIKLAVKAARPDVELSAAVFGGYPACVEGVAQDWKAWIRNDYIDVVAPMDYTDNSATFQGYLMTQMAAGLQSRVLPGIGVQANESNLDAVQTIEQIQAVRRMNAKGFVLYGFDRYLIESVLPVLILGTILD